MGNPDVRDAPNPTAFRMQEAYRWVGEVVADLTEEQLRWQPNPTTPSIRFHLFHIARWADRLHQILTGEILPEKRPAGADSMLAEGEPMIGPLPEGVLPDSVATPSLEDSLVSADPLSPIGTKSRLAPVESARLPRPVSSLEKKKAGGGN